MADLDLGALAQEVTIKDRQGRLWQADPTISAYTAMWLMEAQTKEPGEITRHNVDLVVKALQKFQPKVTEREILEAFTIEDLYQVVSTFLGHRGQSQSSPATTPTNRKSRRAVVKS